MRVEFTNGAYVHRHWAGGSPELLAAFQYRTDAEAFAKVLVADDITHRFSNIYTVTCTYDGKMLSFSSKEAAEAPVAA